MRRQGKHSRSSDYTAGTRAEKTADLASDAGSDSWPRKLHEQKREPLNHSRTASSGRGEFTGYLPTHRICRPKKGTISRSVTFPNRSTPLRRPEINHVEPCNAATIPHRIAVRLDLCSRPQGRRTGPPRIDILRRRIRTGSLHRPGTQTDLLHPRRRPRTGLALLVVFPD